MKTITPELKALYAEMAALTSPRCANTCKIPHSCCSREYCDWTIEYAEEFGIELKPTGNPKLSLMGNNGCIAEPYLRPLCTLHDCTLQAFGVDPHNPEWTDTYFKLRDKINKLEVSAK